MNLSRYAALVLCTSLCAAGNALAQADKRDKPVDLKPLLPPVFPLPPSSQLNPGSVGGTQTPYTTAPLQNPDTPTSQSAPGFRLSIPR
ncbi:MAG TPA: hypothetical protein VH684_27635 [Xanthobacteraceae bacterium]|jgi:hypothetical protein